MEKNERKIIQLVIELTDTKKESNTLKNLKRKNNQLYTVFETSNHLIWMLNAKNELTAFNKNFSNLIYEKYKIKIKLKINIYFKTY